MTPGPAPARGLSGTTIVRARLFVSAYAPLMAILAVRFEPIGLDIACGVVALVGLIDALVIVRGIRAKNPGFVHVMSVRDSGGEAAAFLATYLLPILAAPKPSTRDVVGYAIYVVVLFVIFVRSELAQVNPTLYLLGRRVVAITTTGDEQAYMVCRRKPVDDSEVDCVRLNELLVRTDD